MSEEPTGAIFDIQRFSIHDGPGIRTTVFFQGCPLRCVWCHNPEGLSSETVISFQVEKCIGCGYCFKVCERNAHSMVDERHVLDRAVCTACGACTQECWAGALEMIGRVAGVDDVMAEVMRDRLFYETSGGGITLSGGEPLVQTDFARALLASAGEQGLHRCVETSGAVPMKTMDDVMPFVDMFLFDVKETDDARHREFTGMSNRLILDNLKHLHDNGARILLRLPVVPGYNDRKDHFEAIARLVTELPGLCGVEIMPYHNLGLDKDRRMGLTRRSELPSKSATREDIHEWRACLRDLGVPVTDG